jgi:NAD(P)-dependent dehydrogenase (short-subunit alcohol dehydrogenase family)
MNSQAIVVGASGSFGQAIVGRLLARGLDVLAVARTADSLDALRRLYPAVRCCVADIGQDSAIETIRAQIGATVRMVVHGPGVPVAGGAAQVPTSAVSEAVNLKVNGFLRLVRAADARLGAGSRLVAIGGHYGFEPTAYAATAGIANAALANLVRQLSWTYGPRGVTAHLIAPGPADTERLRKVAAARAVQGGTTVDAVLAEMKADSAIGALTTAEQVAWAVGLLLDPEADALAGSTLMLDSGRRKGLP